jgi:hypothetical protein
VAGHTWKQKKHQSESAQIQRKNLTKQKTLKVNNDTSVSLLTTQNNVLLFPQGFKIICMSGSPSHENRWRPCQYLFCFNERDQLVSLYCKTCRTAEVLFDEGVEVRYCGYCRKLEPLSRFVGNLRVCIVKNRSRLDYAKKKRKKK